MVYEYAYVAIPRLELLGAPTLVLLLIPQIKNIFCWTDSITVLH